MNIKLYQIKKMVYESKIVDVLHNALSTGLSELLNIETYTIPFKLNVANVRIEIYREPKFNNMIIGLNVVMNPQIDSEYLKIWKTYAPGKFIIKDFRKQILDAEGHTPYYEVHYTHGIHKMKALLRKLFELSDDYTDMSEIEKNKLRHSYADIMLKNEYYAIIKICKEEDALGWQTPESHIIDIVHSPFIGTIDGYDVDDVYPEDSIEEDDTPAEHDDNSKVSSYKLL